MGANLNPYPAPVWRGLFSKGSNVAVNKPVGDNARKGAVKKRSQVKTTLDGASAWTKRNTKSGEFMAVKKPAKKSAAKKFKGVRREKAGAR